MFLTSLNPNFTVVQPNMSYFLINLFPAIYYFQTYLKVFSGIFHDIPPTHLIAISVWQRWSNVVTLSQLQAGHEGAALHFVLPIWTTCNTAALNTGWQSREGHATIAGCLGVNGQWLWFHLKYTEGFAGRVRDILTIRSEHRPSFCIHKQNRGGTEDRMYMLFRYILILSAKRGYKRWSQPLLPCRQLLPFPCQQLPNYRTEPLSSAISFRFTFLYLLFLFILASLHLLLLLFPVYHHSYDETSRSGSPVMFASPYADYQPSLAV